MELDTKKHLKSQENDQQSGEKAYRMGGNIANCSPERD